MGKHRGPKAKRPKWRVFTLKTRGRHTPAALEALQEQA